MSSTTFEHQTSTRARRVRWDTAQNDVQGESTAHSFEESPRDQDTEDTSQESHLCLTMMCANGRLACAYFDSLKGIINILEDTEENNHFDLTVRILEQISPRLVLTSSKSDELFMDKVRDQMHLLDGQFQVRPWKEFSSIRGVTKLLSLPFLTSGPQVEEDPDTVDESTEPRNAYEFMRSVKGSAHPTLMHWTAAVRLNNFALDETKMPLCFSAIGALLDHLTRVRAMEGIVSEVDELNEILGIESMTLEEVMQINTDSLLSLQVFLSERHASIYSDCVKEGLSIFGILDQTRTPLGKNLLKQWLHRPSTSLSIIQERQDVVSCFVNPENITTADKLHKSIGGLKGAPIALNRLRKGKATLLNWKSMVQFWVHAVMIRSELLELSLSDSVPLFSKLVELIGSSTFLEVAETINDTIDWEESANVGHIIVQPMVDETLDRWKETLAGMDSLLSSIARNIAEGISPEHAERYRELNVVYFPQLGYLISIPLQVEDSESQMRQGLEGWQFQFMTDDAFYFKSQEMREMDEHVGDLNTYIADREIEIVQHLQQLVLEHANSIMEICEQAAILDCLLSYAAASRQYQWTRPTMTDEVVIDIGGGRHPLQELVDDHFVQNDTYAGDPSNNTEDLEIQVNKVIICTGANASGKSVYLRQCALIPYLAQIGCFVPATSARLGIIERVFTRIQTRESVSKMQSAFMIDLNQVSLALRNASTSRSLLILDEFGKGTLPTDGAALFTGVIKYLLNLGNSCPFVFAATHFHEVMNHSMLSPNLPISFVHMAVMITTQYGNVLEDSTADSSTMDVDRSQSEDLDHERRGIRPGEDVTYLFKVSNGLCLHSHASKCALTWGIPPRVVQRARHVSELLIRNDIGALLDEQLSEGEKQDLVDAEAICRRFLQWDVSTLIHSRTWNGIRDHLVSITSSVENGIGGVPTHSTEGMH
ncbi:hypothetical protein CPB86DRAFT_808461 [Serendipita vermifera]|nr:hypothetical protein CPB86DRAFT_808461 [Serendipita vermifera]